MTTRSMKRSRMGTPTVYRNALVGNSVYGDMSVSGGIVSSDGTYNYHSFTSSGSFTVTGGTLSADILVVAGGGGGGRSDRGGGGGGAGGLLGFTGQTLAAGSYTVTVGAGGGAAGASDTMGTSGTNSQFAALAAAVGGGGGGRTNAGGTPPTGGSGGGGGHQSTAGGAGTAGQGNNGGRGVDNVNNNFNGGGGGGAGAVGTDGSGTSAGGVGSSAYSAWGLATGQGQNVSGTVYFAGGGGGGRQASGNTTPGPGGSGGGGGSAAGTSGTGGTGGGGVGGTGFNAGDQAAGNGGSGIVIVRYPKSAVANTQADFELIGSIELSSAQTSVQFNGIPSDYKHLQLRIVARDTQAVGQSAPYLTFNNDSAANYAVHRLLTAGASVSSYSAVPSNAIMLNAWAAASSTSGIFGTSIVDILDFTSTSKNKVTRSFGGNTNNVNSEIGLNSGMWMSTAAITSIKVTSQAATFLAGSRFSLYGVRA